MNKKITFFLIANKISFIAVFLILAFFNVFFSLGLKSSDIDQDYIRKSDEILVKFKNDAEIYLIKIEKKEDFELILESYLNNPEVEYAEPNYVYHAAIIPTDSYYQNQWYLNKIKADVAWDQARESSNITIAIIDTGVQTTHPDIKDNIWINTDEIPDNGIDDDNNSFIDDYMGWDFVDNTFDPSPKFSEGFTADGILHGTIVAGIAGASGNNATGISGVTWKVKLMPLRVLDSEGTGDTRNVIKSIDYAISNGADIINFSFVGLGYSRSLESAIKRAYDSGIIVVAAAGNEEGSGQGNSLDNVPMYPVCHDGNFGENMVIGVTATDALDQKASFSGFGSKCIDISAPGVSIFSTSVYSPDYEIEGTFFNNYYDGYWAGTSMAVPMVSGAIALLESANPKLSREEVIEILKSSSDNITKLNPDFIGLLGEGRLNVAESIAVAKSRINEKISYVISVPQENSISSLRITDAKGAIKKEFNVFTENFRGGVNVATGDINGDGIDEIITGAGFSGGPHVRIFSNAGKLLGQFFAYDKNFRGGVNVAAGDINGDGIDEIITGAGFSGGPHVRIFDKNGIVEGQFFAYDKNFRGGVNVAVINTNVGARSQKMKILTSPGKGGGPHVRIFDNNAKLLGQFFAYSKNFKGGVSATSVDIDNDGIDEIITGAGSGGTPHVRIFNISGKLVGAYLAFDKNFNGGVNVSSIEY